MGDSKSPEIFGAIFSKLAEYEVERKQIDPIEFAHWLWPMTSKYDFCDSEMEVDDELKELGLYRESTVPDQWGEYPGEYGPEKKSSESEQRTQDE